MRGIQRPIEDLARLDDLAEQRRLYAETVRPKLASPFLEAALRNATVLRLFGVPPQQMADVGDYFPTLLQRIDDVMRHTLMRDNPYLQLATLGRYTRLPRHLETAELRAAAAGSQRISLLHADLRQFIRASGKASLDGIDLLDAADWIEAPGQAELFRSLAVALRPGGRVALRSTSDRILAVAAKAGFELDAGETAWATKQERTTLYAVTALLRPA
jgi:S-adenosylmethionine-diacylglycerol 3-amino-3-carboxypropyl transferase